LKNCQTFRRDRRIAQGGTADPKTDNCALLGQREETIMRVERRTVVKLAVAAGLTALASAAIADSALNVGAYPTNPPFETKTSSGAFEGFEVDIVNEAAKHAGMTTNIADYGFQALFAAIASKRIDVAISSITITPERLKSVSFTQPYYDSDMGVAAKVDSPVKGIADLKGKIVGYLAGSTGEKWVKDNQASAGFADVKGYKAQQDLLLDLSVGRIDGVVSDIPGMQYAFKSMRELTVKERIKTGEQYGLMMAKDDPNLAKLNDSLTALKGDGTLAKIHEKWFGAAPPAGSSTVTVLPIPK
jgi:polar amino acid transport system substrate-binding protein